MEKSKTNVKNLIETAKHNLKDFKPRSAWQKGVAYCAQYLIEQLEECNLDKVCEWDILHTLTSADNWNDYSQGGGFLITDADIAKICCSASELKRYHYDEKNNVIQQVVNGDACYWLHTQSKLLYQAETMLLGDIPVSGNAPKFRR